MKVGVMRRYGLLMILVVVWITTLTGCKALMEQEKVDPTKTAGQSVYQGFDRIDEEGSDEQILAKGGIICDFSKVSKGEGNFKTFMDKVGEGTPCSIRIKQKVGDKEPFYRDLYFDGSRYRLIISTDPEQYDYTYDYLYDLTGRRNKYCRKSRIVFLSNTKDAEFEDVIESIGVNEKEKKINYQLVFRNQ